MNSTGSVLKVIGDTTIPYATAGTCYDYQFLFALDLKDQLSRNWLPAPRCTLPRILAFSKGWFFNRRIAPRFWTGKNFKKVQK
jgi:hypothetical protein